MDDAIANREFTSDSRVLLENVNEDWGFIGELDVGEKFLREIAGIFLPSTLDATAVVVQHIVPNTLPFLSILSELFSNVRLIKKPNSVNEKMLASILKKFNNVSLENITKTDLHTEEGLKHITSSNRNHGSVLFDMGGYFSELVGSNQYLKYGKVLGIIEDTQNGFRRYDEKISEIVNTPTFPIYSVANSPLKEAEDFLVGSSIVEASERALSDIGSSLLNKRAAVLGYGKIGRSISHALKFKTSAVSIFDPNSLRAIQAQAHGFEIVSHDQIIHQADIFFCASGNKSITVNDLDHLSDGAILVSCTSRDDEFGFDISEHSELRESLSDSGGSQKILHNGKDIVLLGGGNAINFRYGNNVGPYIYLVMAEMLCCLSKVMLSHKPNIVGINTISEPEIRIIGEKWLELFSPDGRTRRLQSTITKT